VTTKCRFDPLVTITSGRREPSARSLQALLVAASLVSVAGCGGSSQATVHATPSRIDLGKIAYQGKAATAAITLHNKTHAPVTIQFLRIDGDTPATVSSKGTTCPTQTTLAAGASCLVVVALRADRFGKMEGQLVIGYNRNGSPVTIPIVATGGGTPKLQTPTERLDFGSQPIDGRPTRRLVTLISGGTAAAWLDTYTIQGTDAGDFRFDAAHSNCRSLDAIPPGTTCGLPITFTPTAPGTRTATATLTTGTFIHGQPASRTLRVRLEGRGHAKQSTPSR
jgi:hypothetical protein